MKKPPEGSTWSAPPVTELDHPVGGAGIAGLSTAIASKLAKGLEVFTVRDLLEQIPRRYIDVSTTRPIGQLKIGEDATTRGKVAKVDGRYVRSKRHLLVVTIADGSGYLDLIWWNQPFRARTLMQGAQVVVAGRIERNRGKPAITNPFVETLASGPGIHVGRIIPVHPATQGVTTTQIRRYVHDALQKFGSKINEPLPDGVVKTHSLVERGLAIREMHFPTSADSRLRARRRLVFEELFVLSAGLALRKRRLAEQSVGIAHTGGDDLVERFISSLPFAPTGAQSRAIAEIREDLARTHPMNRLLQGEVGSGKTVVALAAALAAHAGGSQTAFMAPTEVLAEQHYLTVRRLLDPLADHAPARAGALFGEGFGVALLTGSVGAAERRRALDMAASGEAMILVGTHALIQEGVTFQRLGLAIVDEQHRFGVHQRVSLRAKGADGAQPDTLIMTATPIPRTLALTLYGDLDVSTLDEMPPGRTPVETKVVMDDAARQAVYQHIRSQVSRGRQGFIVCPLVEDSASLEVKAAESEFERIRTEVFPDLRVGLIHGRMKSAAKEAVMGSLRAGELDVLVATTVIEVGVDIPNASVMVVEDADRFGLSQLHQLRGRIGRGAHASTCFLFTAIDPEADDAREEAMARLRAMERTNDGFELAELDLEIRGSGQLFGRGSVEDGKGAPLQAGRGDLRFANLVRDVEVLLEAREAAFDVVESDPTLSSASNRALIDEVRRRFADRLDWLFASLMRVIAGTAKGRRLRAAKSARPTTDMTKQSLFDMLGAAPRDADVLDLFAGSGALGIEAISRGAHEATFVDSDRDACAAILSNLEATGLRSQASIKRADALRYLGKNSHGRFDLAFLDPPYERGLGFVARVLDAIAAGRWVREGGTVVVEAPVGPLGWPPGFRETRTRRFGRTQVSMAVWDGAPGDLPGDV